MRESEPPSAAAASRSQEDLNEPEPIERVHAFIANAPVARSERGARTVCVQLTRRSDGSLLRGMSSANFPDGHTARSAWAIIDAFATPISGRPRTLPAAWQWLADQQVGAPDPDDPTLRTALDMLKSALAQIDDGGPHGGDHTDTIDGAFDYRGRFTHITRAEWWPPVPPPVVEGRTPNDYQRWDARDLNGTRIESHMPERAALAYGLSTVRHNQSRFTAIDPAGKRTAFNVTGSSACGMTAHAISADKEATRFLLNAGGVPVPVGRSFAPDAVDEGLAYAKTIGFPVTVKPLAGKRGVGVFTDIQTPEQAAGAIERIRQSEFGGDPFILEEHIHGDAYRVFVVAGHVASMVRYEHGTITGDGELTVAELLLQKDLIRWPNPHLLERRIHLDDAVMQRLSDNGLSLDTVLEADRKVIFTANPNFNQGGESIEVLEETHPTILEAAARAIELVPGMSFSGLDFIIPDHTAPLEGQRAAICEINAHPVLGSGVFPLYGQRRDLPEALVRHAAELDGLQITDKPAPELCVRVTVTGKVQGVFYRRWLSRRAKKANLRGWVRNTTNDKVQAVIAGPTDAVAGMVSGAIHGSRRSKPSGVHTVHVDDRVGDDFAVRDDGPEEV